jgi:peptidase M28-like protein
MVVASYMGVQGARPGCISFSFAALILTATLGKWFGGPSATRSRFVRETGVNLEAVRGANPQVWLVAHIDSKSQRISTAWRTAAVMLISIAIADGVVLSVLHPTNIAAAHEVWYVVGGLAAIGGALLMVCTVGSNSDGAADNASGLAAVLEASALVSPATPLGVLITDAEELALAGARAWVAARAPAIAINCDTIDDDGRFVVMRYARASESLTRRAASAALGEDTRALVIRPLPAVLTDSVAFKHAGWKTVTLSRGTLRTLNRIHTRRDNLQFLRGSAISAAARILARLVEEPV